jgi:hypothetical protein
MPNVSSAERDKIVANMRAQRQATDSALWSALKRTPGILAGGAADIGNLALGLITGRGAKGLVDKPIGGSERINEAFGMPKSDNATQNIAEGVLSMLSPGGAAAAGSKAIIVSAALLKRPEQIRDAAKLTKAGKADEAWQKHGIYIDPLDLEPKTYISAAGASINPAKVGQKGAADQDKFPILTRPNIFNKNRLDYVINDNYPFTGVSKFTLGQVVDFPEAYKAMPDLQDIKIMSEFGGWKSGSYARDTDIIRAGATESLNDLLSVLLHEAQHGVQKRADFMPGGNSEMFYSSPAAKQEIQDALTSLRTVVNEAYAVKYALPGEGKAVQSILDTLNPTIKPLEQANAQAFINYMRLGGESEARAVQAQLANPQLFQTKSPLQVQVDQLTNMYGQGTDRIGLPDWPLVPTTLQVDQTPEMQLRMQIMQNPLFQDTLNQFTKYLQSKKSASPPGWGSV